MEVCVAGAEGGVAYVGTGVEITVLVADSVRAAGVSVVVVSTHVSVVKLIVSCVDWISVSF